MSFEVTVTPTVYNVEVEVNPSVQPFDVVVEVGNVPDLDLTTNGDSGASTFNPLTGELNIPEYTLDGLGGVPETRTITINGTTQDLSADRTFTIPAPDPVTIGSPANGLSITSGQVLSLALASGSQTGALSSGDWTTFNGKQNALTNPITGTGASGQVAFFNGTSSQTGDNGLFWDNVNKRLGIGTNAPSCSFDVNTGDNLVARFVGNYVAYQNTVGALGSGNSIEFATNSNIPRIDFVVGGIYTGAFSASGTNLELVNNSASGNISLRIGGSPTFRLFGSTRNFLIQNGGTFTDAGFRLDVNGTARVQGALTLLPLSTSNYQINSSVFGGRLGFQNLNTAQDCFIDLFSNTSGNRSIGFVVWARGIPGSITNSELLEFRYDAANTRFALNILQLGTGVVRPLHIYTGTNTNQLKIQTNGNVSINSSSDVASAQLQVDSTTAGFLPPRMTSAQRDLIATPAAGLVVYNTTDNLLSFYNGTAWTNL